MARLRSMSAAVDLMRSRLTGEPRRQELIRVANQVIGQAAETNRRATGREIDRVIFVDGRQGAQISTVKPGGTVVALFAVHVAAVDFAWETLAQLSPIDVSPRADDIRYREHHLLLVNGEQQTGRPGSPVHIGADDIVTFVNLLGYARRLEQGYSQQAPDGIYEVASAIIKAKFGNIVTVRFGYGAFLGATADRQNRYPFITLSPKARRR